MPLQKGCHGFLTANASMLLLRRDMCSTLYSVFEVIDLALRLTDILSQ